MKYIIIFFALLPGIPVNTEAQVNNGKKWKVKQVEIVFKNIHSSLYHMDSSQNLLNFENLSFRFYGDGTYKKYLGSDSSFVGPWSLNTTADSVIMDNIPFKLIKLDADSFTTRGYNLQLADAAGALDTSFSYLRLYSIDDVVLPVTLLTFTASYNASRVKVQWSTASEMNSHHFDVLRSSDGINFVSAGIVMAAGNSTVQHDYILNDINYQEGINYYRLKQVDIDGRFTLSDIVALTITSIKGFAVNIYPNPAKEDILIETVQKHDELTLTINNVNGQTVLTKIIPKDVAKTPIKISGFAKGVYQVTLRDKKNAVVYAGQLVLQ